MRFGRLMLIAAVTIGCGLAQDSAISVNGQPLSTRQVAQLRMLYGRVYPGCYWYDARSGLFGFCGRETAGLIRPGHRFAPMPADASDGDTGVFVNGRELPALEVSYLQRLFGVVYPDHYWLNANGEYGVEGGGRLGNVYQTERGTRSSHRLYSAGEIMGVFGAGGNYCTDSGCVYTSR